MPLRVSEGLRRSKGSEFSVQGGLEKRVLRFPLKFLLSLSAF